MAALFLILQFSSLMFQLFCLVKGWKSNDMLGTYKGYAIWGGAVTVLLGVPIQTGLVS